jgi:hypothetical protein
MTGAILSDCVAEHRIFAFLPRTMDWDRLWRGRELGKDEEWSETIGGDLRKEVLDRRDPLLLHSGWE